MGKEMVYSILFTLLQRHEDAAEYYEKAADLASDSDLKDLLDSLASYRREMGLDIRDFLEQSSPIPVRNKDKKATTSRIHKEWEKVQQAFTKNNRVEILHICRSTEETLSEYYKDSLGSGAIAEGIRDLLQKQHDKVLEITRKVERQETVPSRRHKEI